MKKLSQETINKILEAAEKAREKGIRVKLNLSYCDLCGLDLIGANLSGADLKHSDLWGADLGGANLGCANLQGANLRGACLDDANLFCVNLEGASLMLADLEGANLRRTNLKGANLQRANLQGADLDFSVFNLSYNSRNIKADDRLINQLLWHVANIMKTSGREIPENIKDMANQSHVIEEYEFEKF